MSVSTYTPDERFDCTLEVLQQHYGAASKAEVIRKAVALLVVVSEHEDADGAITLKRGGRDLRIVVR
jgi:hypothetical protein